MLLIYLPIYLKHILILNTETINSIFNIVFLQFQNLVCNYTYSTSQFELTTFQEINIFMWLMITKLDTTLSGISLIHRNMF